MAKPRKILIFDTTLRDGEQSPGCSMNIPEKIEIAKALEVLKVDIIEAGFAVSSPGDFKSVQAVAEALKDPIVCSLARAVTKDIDAAAEALAKAKHPRIHTFIATSPIHMEYKLKMKPAEVIERAVAAVKYARSKVADVEFSAEDAGRSDPKFLVKIFTEVIKAGASTINIPDTVGYTRPEEFGKIISYVMKNVPNIKKAVVSVHCHNDLGLAVANSLEAIYRGAGQVECTVNGIGERAGNCAIEELVMNLKTRKDYYKAETNIETKHIYKTSRLLSSIIGVEVQPNKPIVGANAFAHESGIHQDGILKKRETYEIMDAQDIGMVDNVLVLGKHSGRHAFVSKLKALGYNLSEQEIEKAFNAFKELADKKKEITERDLIAIVSDEVTSAPELYKLELLHIETGNDVQPSARVKVSRKGEMIDVTEKGVGPVDALLKAIDSAVKRDVEKIDLVDYIVHAVTEGTDALGQVSVRVRDGQKILLGRGAHMDVLVASAEAYLNAINKMLDARQNNKG